MCKTDHHLIFRGASALNVVKMFIERSWKSSVVSWIPIIHRQTKEGVERKRNALVDKSESGGVETWKNIKGLADRCGQLVISLHKKTELKECTNYRRISLLSLPGKVYAKCLKPSV